MENKNYKAGFVSIIGRPNAGKSTLMNAMMGEKLSVITAKAQTTRHRIMGIFSGEDFQIVYSDTPGYMDPGYKLHEKMMTFVKSALEDADLFLWVKEIGEKVELDEVTEKIVASKRKIILVLNKVDLSEQEAVAEKANEWQQLLGEDVQILPISALHKFNLDVLFDMIKGAMPTHPPYYDEDTLTDKNMRFFVSEIVRGKMLDYYKQEIPYSSEVVVEEYKEDEKIIRIRAVIYVERDSQKGIVIGAQGKAIKRLGIESRRDIENFVGKQVHLETFVKVMDDWRKNDNALKKFGYE